MIDIGNVVKKLVKQKCRKKFFRWISSIVFSSFGGYMLLIIMVFAIISGICGAMANSQGNNPGKDPSKKLPPEVESYRSVVTQVATKYEVADYVDLILAIMAAESGGRGSDPMQASECGYNTKYPHIPSGITDVTYSIECGTQMVRDCIKSADVENKDDIEHIKVACQGYNFGLGYISDAKANAGGLWIQEHVYDFARRYSNNTQRTTPSLIERIGIWAYGDQHYPDHVLIYYSSNTSGDGNIVNVALSQLGNIGGETYWRWYGFSSRVEWCACFVSWCLNECGYIESGEIPKFASCPTGANWFRSQGRWKVAGEIPNSGDIIFFDWENSGHAQHIGIVESVEGETIHTIEGNSDDMCIQRQYSISSRFIFGYGVI